MHGAPNDKDVRPVVAEGADHGEDAAPEELAAGEIDVLVVDFLREGGEAAGEVAGEVVELELLRALAAAGGLAQVVHLALRRCLAEVLGVAEEGVVGFAEEGRQDAEGEQQHQPRRVEHEDAGEDGGGDDLLQQAAHHLDHRQPVGGLDAGAFEAVVEDRVLVGGEVELGGLLHDPDADGEGIPVGEQAVQVVDRPVDRVGDDGDRPHPWAGLRRAGWSDPFQPRHGNHSYRHVRGGERLLPDLSILCWRCAGIG